MAYRKELSRIEKDQLALKRKKLLEKFPGGIAEIEAVCTRREPAVEGRASVLDYQSPVASSTPAIPVYLETGGTHPGSGMPEVKVQKHDISIWPVSGRTDQAGILNKYYSPIELLEMLVDDKMRLHNGRPIYRLKPVPVAELEAEKKAFSNPDSRANFEKLRGDKVLQGSEESVQRRSSVRVVPVAEIVDDGREVDFAEQLNEDDLVDDEAFVGSEEPEVV